METSQWEALSVWQPRWKEKVLRDREEMEGTPVEILLGRSFHNERPTTAKATLDLQTFFYMYILIFEYRCSTS